MPVSYNPSNGLIAPILNTKNIIKCMNNASKKEVKYLAGDICSTEKYQLKVILTSEDDLNTVSNLKAGELSGVVKTASGYAIFRGDGANVPADFADETMLDTVNTYMITYEAGLIEDYFINGNILFWIYH